MADKLMRKVAEDNDSTLEIARSFQEAVCLSTRLEPECTVAHIKTVYLPNLRAFLWVAAAGG